MDRMRKKELIREYLETKTPMGILSIKNVKENKVFLDVDKDTKSKINRLCFQLDLGSCPARELQKDWKRLGKDSFEIKVLELLEYDKDESKTDYSEELKILVFMWQDKLEKQGCILYK